MKQKSPYNLIKYYANINDVIQARLVYDGIQHKNIHVCSAMIKCYIANKKYKDALELYLAKHGMGMDRDKYWYIMGVNICANLRDKINGNIIYNEIKNTEYYNNIEILNTLLHYFGIINDIDSCEYIFNRIHNKNIVSYNSMMTAYNSNKLYSKGLKLFMSNDIKYIRNEISYIVGLNLCMNLKDTINGNIIYNDIRNKGYRSIKMLSTIINYFGSVNDINKCQTIYSEIEKKNNTVLHNAMLKAYVTNKLYDKALSLFMTKIDISNEISHVYGLSSCANMKDVKNGEIICGWIQKNNYKSIEMLTGMIQYYGNINLIDRAETIFNSVDKKDIILRNSMIKAYVNCEKYQDGLAMYLSMKNKDSVSYTLGINLCAQLRDKTNGDVIYEEVLRKNKLNNVETQTSLIQYFGSIDEIEKAEQIFNGIKRKDVYVYNNMVKCYISTKNYENGLTMLLSQNMCDIRDHISCVMGLNICSILKDEHNGTIFCDEIHDKGYDNIEILTGLIHYYGNINCVEKAENLFHSITDKNVSLYNCMIKAYINCEMYEKGLELYLSEGMKHIKDYVSYIVGLNVCSMLKDVKNGTNIYVEIKNNDVSDIEVQNSLIGFFGSINDIEKCEEIFNGIKIKNIVSYNSMMKTYLNNNKFSDCLDIFMSKNMVSLRNNISYVLGLNACINLNDKLNGDVLCSQIENKGYNDIEILTTLINYYGTFNDIEQCIRIYSKITNKNIITHNSMIKAYLNNELYDDALQLYLSDEIKNKRNGISYVLGLNASTYLKDKETGIQIHSEINGKNYNDIEIYNALIYFYGNINDIEKSQNIFNETKNKTIETYNTMMKVYRINTMHDELMEMFDYLSSQNEYKLDMFTYSTALMCAGDMSSLSNGLKIINSLNSTNNTSLINNISIQCSMISMFGKCNELSQSITIFTNNTSKPLSTKDKLSLYGAMMDIYSRSNEHSKVFQLYNNLITTNIPPDNNIYSIIINCCSHSGNIKTAESIYTNLKSTNKLHPYIITTIIDCYSRNNSLDKALKIYFECNNIYIFYKDRIKMLMSILNGCRLYSDINRGKQIIKLIEKEYQINKISKIDPNVYILYNNIKPKHQ